MPRVSESYRAARREEIARAALRCLERTGVHDTSIADVVKESGLSTGAIYSHFTNKAELARYIAEHYLVVRVDALEKAGRRGEVTRPRDALASVLRTVTDDGIAPRLVLQFWSESTVDPDLGAVVTRTARRLHEALRVAMLPWARSRVGEEGADAEAARAVATLIPVAQGYIAHSAVFGRGDVDAYLDGLVHVLGDEPAA